MANFPNYDKIKNYIKYRFKGDRKYFTIVFFIFILILFNGFLTPYLVRLQEENWNDELKNQIAEIEKESHSFVKSKEKILIDISKELKKDFYKINISKNKIDSSILTDRKTNIQKKKINFNYYFFSAINNDKYKNHLLYILDSNKDLIAYNNTLLSEQDLKNENSFNIKNIGETKFFPSDLYTFLIFIDTIKVEDSLFYIISSISFEKYFSFYDDINSNESFSSALQKKFNLTFNINYTPSRPKTNNPDEYSFDIVNNKGIKIGLITFEKPELFIHISNLREKISLINSILIILIFIFFGLTVKNDFKFIKSRLLKFILVALYLGLFRFIIFKFNIPSDYIEGSLTNANYFSSKFGNGIVKSPIEFLITTILVFLLILYGFVLINNFFGKSISSGKEYNFRNNKFKLLFYPSIILITFVSLLAIRGFAASTKSVIFDSTLRYFKEPTIIPDLPKLVMNLGILFLGISFVLLFLCGLLLIFSFIKNSNRIKSYFLLTFIFFEVCGILFILLYKNPLIDIPIILITIFLIFLIFYYLIFNNKEFIYVILYSTLIASIISITYLNYFNSKLERESLKRTALEINRPSEYLLGFLLNESLLNISNNKNLIDIFYKKNINYNSQAFILWNKSSLFKEPIFSSISILNRNKNILGNFSYKVENKYLVPQIIFSYPISELKIFDVSENRNPERIIFSGIIPIENDNYNLGYICITIIYDNKLDSQLNLPKFLLTNKTSLNDVVDISNLNIFRFINNELNEVYGNFYPTQEQINQIVKRDYSQSNEAWVDFNLNSEKYIAYALKQRIYNKDVITVISLKEKEITWSIFNFFKLFLIHFIFILIFYLIIILIKIKDFKTFFYNFRTQLVLAFLFISIIPLISAAIYNRTNVNEKIILAYKNGLNDRINLLVNQINNQLKMNPQKDFQEIFKKASEELSISFNVYYNDDLFFSSDKEFVDANVFSNLLNSEANFKLNLAGYNEFFNKEKIDSYSYYSLYKKVNLEGNNFIFNNNNAFNNIEVTFSTIEVDVFLFGIYSIAILIIIILSTIIANRISSPIRKLTKATQSVAHGDFSVSLLDKGKGDIGELISGFNQMTQDLKRSQEELAELERENAWKEMAKQVAHEIKNPLTPMKLTLQQLITSYKDKTKNFDELFDKITTTILNQIDNLNQIASEFSRFAKMPNINLETIDLIKSINEIIYLFNDEKCKINFQTTLIEAFVNADNSQFKRVLINLIRNSIQANAKVININLESNSSDYVLHIIDNGKGIPLEYQNKIFETNFTTKKSGMGIGLKLSKKFIENINGKIYLEYSYSGNTSFVIELPKIN
ncbi:MAG: hypothetical protein STSR0008_09410 [Ignavibacterium sp.]